MKKDNEIVCTLNNVGVREAAKDMRTTRSAAAVDMWMDKLEGSIVVIGNAPTALFRLLEKLEAGAPGSLEEGEIHALHEEEELLREGELPNVNDSHEGDVHMEDDQIEDQR